MSEKLKTIPRKRLIELRKNKGTQRKVAAELGITETYLRLLERGTATPSVEVLFKTAHYLNSDVYDCWGDLAGKYAQSV